MICTVRGSIPERTISTAPVQTDAGVHVASFTVSTGSFPGVNRPGRVPKHPCPCSAEVKKSIVISVLTQCAFMACCRVNLPFILSCLRAVVCEERLHISPSSCLCVRFETDQCLWSFAFSVSLKFVGASRFKSNKNMKTYIRLWSLTVFLISGTSYVFCEVSIDAKGTFF
jgi:hypothetical protein